MIRKCFAILAIISAVFLVGCSKSQADYAKNSYIEDNSYVPNTQNQKGENNNA